MDRDVQLVAFSIFQAQVLTLQAIHGAIYQANKATNAMINVHDPIARVQICIGSFRSLSNRAGALAQLRAPPTKDLTISEQMQDGSPRRGEDESLRK